MPDTTSGNRGRNRQKIPRIGPEEAARVFAQCEDLLASSPVFVENLRQAGFARFLAPLHEKILGARGAAGTHGASEPGPV